MENSARRDGRPIEEIRYYNPISEELRIDKVKTDYWTFCNPIGSSSSPHLLISKITNNIMIQI